MKAFLCNLLVLGLFVLMATPVIAEEKPAKKQGKNTPRPIVAVEKQLAELDLSNEQKKKVDDILASYKKKFAEAQAKGPRLTKEQRQIQKDATAKAKAEGKKRKELQAEVDAALNLTEEQKQSRQQAAAAQKELQAALKKDLAGVLNAEQVAKLSPKKKKNS